MGKTLTFYAEEQQPAGQAMQCARQLDDLADIQHMGRAWAAVGDGQRIVAHVHLVDDAWLDRIPASGV